MDEKKNKDIETFSSILNKIVVIKKYSSPFHDYILENFYYNDEEYVEYDEYL
jgi:hypothetical protein